MDAASADRLFGLIGYPLSHSFSKKYFNQKFEKERISGSYYELFPLSSIQQFPSLMEQYPRLAGLNVTIPYKQAIMPLLNRLDEGAEAVGAVNTIKVSGHQLIGYNTDVFGFEQSLVNFLQDNQQSAKEIKALILGTGGASKAVAFVLQNLDINYKYVSRRKSPHLLTYEEIDAEVLEQYQLIINTTPLGMSPNEGSLPSLPYSLMDKKHLLFDLVYNPSETAFMKAGKKRGAAAKNGLEMLYLQAEKAWKIWNEKI